MERPQFRRKAGFGGGDGRPQDGQVHSLNAKIDRGTAAGWPRTHYEVGVFVRLASVKPQQSRHAYVSKREQEGCSGLSKRTG